MCKTDLEYQNPKFTSLNIYFPKSAFRFKNQNQHNKILISVKTKSASTKNRRFRHFWLILHRCARAQKYASFEGVKIHVTPLFYRQLGTKKALTKSAIFANSRVSESLNLVQNVKNQFLHKFSSRGIWVVQTLTFGVNLAYLRNYPHHLHS